MRKLTCNDDRLGEGSFDSIKWALETHCRMTDNAVFNSAILYGNEDAPSKIAFFSQADPEFGDTPLYTWSDSVLPSTNHLLD